MAILAASLSARAQDFMPYPNERVTGAQWQSYYDLVRVNHGATEERRNDLSLLLYADAGSDMQFAFTQPDHPAHPAWITRQLVEENGRFFVKQIGYFAGDETAFAQLFAAYEALTEQMNESMQRR
jgi:hypothetical protein